MGSGNTGGGLPSIAYAQLNLLGHIEACGAQIAAMGLTRDGTGRTIVHGRPHDIRLVEIFRNFTGAYDVYVDAREQNIKRGNYTLQEPDTIISRSVDRVTERLAFLSVAEMVYHHVPEVFANRRKIEDGVLPLYDLQKLFQIAGLADTAPEKELNATPQQLKKLNGLCAILELEALKEKIDTLPNRPGHKAARNLYRRLNPESYAHCLQSVFACDYLPADQLRLFLRSVQSERTYTTMVGLTARFGGQSAQSLLPKQNPPQP